MGRSENLTARQTNILDFIVEHQDEHGYPPSLREIGDFFHIHSTNGVSDHLRALERKGYVVRNGQQSRGLTILRRPQGTLYQSNLRADSEFLRLPVLGNVAAGQPLLALQEYDEQVTIDPSLLGGGQSEELFALRVQGRSMVGAGIFPGDLIFVRRSARVDNGRIAVVMIDGAATVKRFYHEGDRIRLQPENPEMTPMIIASNDTNTCEVIGTVVGLYRKLD